MTDNKFELSPYGESTTKRLVIPSAENILYKPYNCLDHGFVRLVDYMGGDSSIVQAARVSYGKGTKKVSDDRALIRYLMRHEHNTPFEMVELKFHAKMPIFVARQWIRHRTASVNEISGRYSDLEAEFYIPLLEDLGLQSKNNKQGREGYLEPKKAEFVRKLLIDDALNDAEHYKLLQETGLARELSRIGLGLNVYTQWYWKIDLHNLFHFLKLRKDSHAQKEIRVYADIMGDITSKVVPFAYESFEDYKLNETKLSRLEVEVISKLVSSPNNIHGLLMEIDSHIRESKEKKFIGVDYMGMHWDRLELEELREKLEVIVGDKK